MIAAALFGFVAGMVALGVVIRVAVAPLLAEVRALRVDVASGLDRVARRQSVEAPTT